MSTFAVFYSSCGRLGQSLTQRMPVGTVMSFGRLEIARHGSWRLESENGTNFSLNTRQQMCVTEVRPPGQGNDGSKPSRGTSSTKLHSFSILFCFESVCRK